MVYMVFSIDHGERFGLERYERRRNNVPSIIYVLGVTRLKKEKNWWRGLHALTKHDTTGIKRRNVPEQNEHPSFAD